MQTGNLSELFRVLDLTGVFANAIIGGLVARHERLDPIGFLTFAVLSGLGGGIIRDVLLQHGPPIALQDYAYLLTALAGAAITYVANVSGPVWDRVWPVIDAIALGTWAAAGAQKSLSVGIGWLPAILLGTITAVGGGAIRDIVTRRVPTVLGGNTLYATSAILASGVLVVCTENGHPTVGLAASTVTGGGLCLLARWRGWMLPEADAWSAPRRVAAKAGLDRARREKIALALQERAARARPSVRTQRKRSAVPPIVDQEPPDDQEEP